MPKDFYVVYAHINPKTGKTFYVGKGRNNRPYEYRGRNPKWHEIVKTLNGHYKVEILEKGLSQEEAEELEYQYIKKFGKLVDGTGTLVNLADGVWGLREDLNLNELAIQAFKENLKKPEFLKNIKTMSEIFARMRTELGMAEQEIEEWYLKEIDETAECKNCGCIWDINELIEGKYCPECKAKIV